MDTYDDVVDENMRLRSKLGALQGEVKELKLQLESSQKTSGKTRIQWEAKKSDSGIELVGGASTLTKYGTLVGTTLAPVGPNQMGLLLIVLEDSGAWAIIEAGAAKALQ